MVERQEYEAIEAMPLARSAIYALENQLIFALEKLLKTTNQGDQSRYGDC